MRRLAFGPGLSLSLALVSMIAIAPAASNAWGFDGHRMISRAGVEALPDSVPSFLRAPQAIGEIEVLGPEADLLEGAGRTFDRDEQPAHYVNVSDDGRIGGALTLSQLPEDREAYDTQLRAAGSDQYKAGFLPYSLIDGFEVVRQDFSYWRVEDLGASKAATAADRATFARLRALRETFTLRDIGFWSHFVADASQPLHVSARYNGWEPRYPGSKGIHARFESVFVSEYLTPDAVRARVKPFVPCGCTIQQAVERYLAESNAQVIPLYDLNQSGAFASRTDAGVNFAAGRLAAGATELRNLIVEAWTGSEDGSVGYPATKVRDLESGRAPLTVKLIGGG